MNNPLCTPLRMLCCVIKYMENTVFELMLNVSLGNMVCRLHQIDGMFVYGAYFEVLVG